MSKIVSALNVMILNQSKISNCIEGTTDDELYFLYDGKYKWSIMEHEGSYYLNYYPGQFPLEEIAALRTDAWNDLPRVSYHSDDVGGKEALETFKELNSIVKERLYNMDGVLDDIISSDESLI